MVQKKSKGKKVLQSTPSNSMAVDGFNSMFSMFESNGKDDETETKIQPLIFLPDDNIKLKDEEKEKEIQKKEPKKIKRKLLIDQPTAITTNTTNTSTTSTTINTNNSNNTNNNNEISKILDFKKKELENRELDILVKEKEIKRQRKDIKEEMDKMKVALNKQKVLLEQNKNSSVSIAIPSNVLANVTSEEMKTYVIEMISRQVTMNKIDEIIVFKTDDYNEEDAQQQSNLNLLLKILEYIETPHYLRKELIDTLDKDYFFIDKLNEINSCHQQSEQEEEDSKLYREGVVTNEHYRNQSIVNVGLPDGKLVIIPKRLNAGTRLTIDIKTIDESREPPHNEKYINGTIISPSSIKKEGYYWGHHIRLVDSLEQVASTCQYQDTKTYDYIIMLSQYGEPFPSYTDPVLNNAKKYNHLLIIFADANASSTVNPEFKLTSEVLVPDTHINTIVNFNNQKLRFEENLSITLSKLKGIFFY